MPTTLSKKNHQISLSPGTISIYNPGSFPEGKIPEDYVNKQLKSILRNKLICDVLFKCKYIESWCSGFKKVFDLCHSNNVQIKYMKDYDGFWFTFIRKKMWDLQTIEAQLNDKEMKILELIINDNKISYEKICFLTNYSYSTVSRTINTLKQKNKIKFFGSKKTGKWIVISEKLV